MTERTYTAAVTMEHRVTYAHGSSPLEAVRALLAGVERWTAFDQSPPAVDQTPLSPEAHQEAVERGRLLKDLLARGMEIGKEEDF